MRVPFLPIDPEEIGPWELVVSKWEQLKVWARQPIISIVLMFVGAIVLVGAWRNDVSLPEIPNWGWVAIFSSILGFGVAWFVGKRLASEMHDPPTIVISVLNAYNGQQRIIRLSPERFSEMSVVNHRGDVVGSERLREVVINGERAYEVDQYDPVLNIATTSWQADRSNKQIRHDHSKIETIKTELDYEVDKAYDLLSQHTQIVRDILSDYANQMVMVAEDVELPQGAVGGLHDRIHDDLEELDPSEELLEDELDEDDPEAVDIEIDGGKP